MIVVSDTTPIISLIKIEKLELLKNLFGEILIPEAVFRELTTNNLFSDEAEIVKKCEFLNVVSVQNKKSLEVLQKITGLDDGESESIIIVDEQKSDLLIMDERKGRKVAEKMGITLTGTVGILIQAFNEKMISADDVKLCLQNMRNQNIRISESLVEKVLARLN